VSRSRSFVAVASLLVLVALIAPAAAAPRIEPVPRLGHVFVIIGENTSRSQLSATKAPFQVGTLKPASAWLTDYSATTHWSTANYIAMTSGQYTDCEQLDLGPADCHQGVENIFHELTAAGISWQEWNESMPEPCALESAGKSVDGNSYRVKHNPAVYYDNVEGTGGTWSATDRSSECLDQVIPTGGTGFNDMQGFEGALMHRTFARFNFIVPNQCEDGHDNCPPKGNGITAYDGFLAREVPLIQDVMGPNDLLIVTYDEGQGAGPNHGDKFGGGNVAFAVYGALVAPGVYKESSNHYGLLRTLEDGFRTGTHAGAAATTYPIGTIWK
jgi:phosphatidylinositol-3-phosphatase